MWFGTLTQNRNFLSGLQRSFKPDEEVSRYIECVYLSHTRTCTRMRTPPTLAKSSSFLLICKFLQKRRIILWNRTLIFFAQNTCTLTPKSSHIAEYICIGRTLWVQLTPGSTAFFIAVKTKTSSTQASVCCQCNMSKLCMFTGTDDSTKNFLPFSRLGCCISCTASSPTIASLFGDFSILVYTLQYSRWLTVALFSAYVGHMFWKLWLSISLRLH